MSRLWTCISALIIATAFLFVGTTEPASALCKPGTPHCTKQGPVCVGQCYRFRVLDSDSTNTNTPGNAGDCVGKCYRFRVLDDTK
jgi:hypothetical protein